MTVSSSRTVLGHVRVGVFDRRRRVGHEIVLQAFRVLGDDGDADVFEVQIFLDRPVDVRPASAWAGTPALRRGNPDSRNRWESICQPSRLAERLGVELRVIEEISPDELEAFLGDPLVDELLQLPQRLADDEVAVGIGQRPDPDREILLLAGVVGRRELVAALDEMLDVGVIAVVLAALLADLLEKERDMLAVLAEVRARRSRGRKSPCRLSSERLGKPMEIAVAGVGLSAITNSSPWGMWAGGRLRRGVKVCGQPFEIGLDPGREIGGISAGEPDDDVALDELLLVEGLDVVERQILSPIRPSRPRDGRRDGLRRASGSGSPCRTARPCC